MTASWARSTEEQREIMGDILTSARHLLQLISDILDLSKVEAGKMEFHPEPTRIEKLVHEVRDVVRPLAERKSLHWSSVPDGLSGVWTAPASSRCSTTICRTR